MIVKYLNIAALAIFLLASARAVTIESPLDDGLEQAAQEQRSLSSDELLDLMLSDQDIVATFGYDVDRMQAFAERLAVTQDHEEGERELYTPWTCGQGGTSASSIYMGGMGGNVWGTCATMNKCLCGVAKVKMALMCDECRPACNGSICNLLKSCSSFTVNKYGSTVTPNAHISDVSSYWYPQLGRACPSSSYSGNGGSGNGNSGNGGSKPNKPAVITWVFSNGWGRN